MRKLIHIKLVDDGVDTHGSSLEVKDCHYLMLKRVVMGILVFPDLGKLSITEMKTEKGLHDGYLVETDLIEYIIASYDSINDAVKKVNRKLKRRIWNDPKKENKDLVLSFQLKNKESN